MRIAVLAVGTRGDVLPLVALAAGLQAAGHDVTLATSTAYARQAHWAKLAFVPLEGDPNDLLASVQVQAWRSAGQHPLRFPAHLATRVAPLADQLLEDAWPACADAEAIVWTPRTPVGHHVAEALGVPAVLAGLQPLTPNAEFPCPPIPALPLPGFLARAYNRGASLVAEQGAWLLFRSMARRWRRRLGLPPPGLRSPGAEMRARGATVLYGFSPRVVPKPAGWGRQARVTGYWVLPAAGWEAPPALERFLASGSAPIGICFGGAAGKVANRALEVTLEALTFSGERAVVIGGDLDRIPARLLELVFPLAEAPHQWLFPRLSMVVHHGGAGTTAAALRAGVPSVVLPFFGDQPFWGRRVQRLRAGPRPVPAHRASPADLVVAFDRALHDPTIRANASLAGRLLREEDGVGEAVRAVEEAVVAVQPGLPAAVRAVPG